MLLCSRVRTYRIRSSCARRSLARAATTQPGGDAQTSDVTPAWRGSPQSGQASSASACRKASRSLIGQTREHALVCVREGLVSFAQHPAPFRSDGNYACAAVVRERPALRQTVSLELVQSDHHRRLVEPDDACELCLRVLGTTAPSPAPGACAESALSRSAPYRTQPSAAGWRERAANRGRTPALPGELQFRTVPWHSCN